ncbi:hypothetical protein Pan241w_34900 [Gimesia alba]|uniref:Uncharacterized protein n=1 Tax=Gimesia alba TaxID=2527973 RepID=A0A517RHQ0_9PLAN|nr:hypothetical protein [Gimesia alba]QDT43390.1 hypothetical protein Pan241w_34900 [Gimesia alba]
MSKNTPSIDIKSKADSCLRYVTLATLLTFFSLFITDQTPLFVISLWVFADAVLLLKGLAAGIPAIYLGIKNEEGLVVFDATIGSLLGIVILFHLLWFTVRGESF